MTSLFYQLSRCTSPIIFSGISGGGDKSEDRVQQRPQIRLRGRRARAAASAQLGQEEGLLHARRQGGAAAAPAGYRRQQRHAGGWTGGGPEEGGGGGGGPVSGREGGAAVLAALPGDGAAPGGAVDLLATCVYQRSFGRIYEFPGWHSDSVWNATVGSWRRKIHVNPSKRLLDA